MAEQGELAALIERYAPQDGSYEVCGPRCAVVRTSQPSEPVHGVFGAAVCVVAQGTKQVICGGQTLIYDALRYVVASVDLPVIGQVIEATPETPYLCFRMELDPEVIGDLLLQTGAEAALAHGGGPLIGAMAVSEVNPPLLDAVMRMVRLMETPRDAAVLAPLIEREILYRILLGDQGPRLAQITRANGRMRQVRRAIGWIKQHFDEPFRIEDLAAEARMSPSALHRHFKAVTALSPLQYQKQIRLQEARKLILVQRLDAGSAGHAVGYDSASQFSREYARLFGAPPLRDVARLRGRPDMLVET
ncbi:AraC family transcriptional regulator N-terminal domain-containing protein [Caulobacter sp. DWP3-1-3b2]|uniref:AraC family transcriptional regulator n=1 Tax=Caulobacter sp. DWP3-1-3b2 TaxID=2804643 RepID=UPI003CF940AF